MKPWERSGANEAETETEISQIARRNDAPPRNRGMHGKMKNRRQNRKSKSHPRPKNKQSETLAVVSLSYILSAQPQCGAASCCNILLICNTAAAGGNILNLFLYLNLYLPLDRKSVV